MFVLTFLWSGPRSITTKNKARRLLPTPKGIFSYHDLCTHSRLAEEIAVTVRVCCHCPNLLSLFESAVTVQVCCHCSSMRSMFKSEVTVQVHRHLQSLDLPIHNGLNELSRREDGSQCGDQDFANSLPLTITCQDGPWSVLYSVSFGIF